jgi:RNA polymerase sigma factor (TIGR02999 family)
MRLQLHMKSTRITRLLQEWSAGDGDALNTLIPLVHNELQRLARLRVAGEQPGLTLQPTDLVNEAYLRLLDIKEVQWQDRDHFFAVAATVMRRILVDASRHRGAQKRGDGVRPVSLDDVEGQVDAAPQDLLALDEALRKLETFDARKAKIVELRFFMGLSVEQAALALSVSAETVKRDWRLAKAWLRQELSDGGSK